MGNCFTIIIRFFINNICIYIFKILFIFIFKNRLSVTKTYCGHGIGHLFHVMPTIPHYRDNKTAGFMKVGHVFTIEPMIN